MSIELGRLFAQLDRMPGRSLVVLHNDHGEEFWEHGAFEHNHALYDEVTRALLAFRSGGGQTVGQRIAAPVTLADIGPTLYEFAGLTSPTPVDGRSLAPLLDGRLESEVFSDRPIGIAHLRYGAQRWGVVLRDHKYVLHTASGEEELYDLSRDPGEQANLVASGTTDLVPFRAALAQAHEMRVGPGWRVTVKLMSKDRRPFAFRLPAPAVAAGVIDPEAAVATPANQAWGEEPNRTEADVGSVTLSDDKQILTFTPAPASSGRVDGLLYVLFEAAQGTDSLTLRRADAPLEPTTPGSWSMGTDRLRVSAGTVLVPPRSEADRIRTLRGATEDAGENRALLEVLGYVEEDDSKVDGEQP